MTSPPKKWQAFALCLSLFGLPDGAIAQGLPALSPDAADQLKAVGRLGHDEFVLRQGCTATLIAPNLIVTAAHCASGRGTSRKQFYAGWTNQMFIAQAGTILELRHPAYGISGEHSPRHDVALIVLDQDIEDVAALPLANIYFDINHSQEVALVGYHRNSPDALSGNLDCPARITRNALMMVECQVINGNSGSPVLGRTEEGDWQIIAIVSSKIGQSAIAVPIPEWLHDQVAEHRSD